MYNISPGEGNAAGTSETGRLTAAPGNAGGFEPPAPPATPYAATSKSMTGRIDERIIK